MSKTQQMLRTLDHPRISFSYRLPPLKNLFLNWDGPTSFQLHINQIFKYFMIGMGLKIGKYFFIHLKKFSPHHLHPSLSQFTLILLKNWCNKYVTSYTKKWSNKCNTIFCSSYIKITKT